MNYVDVFIIVVVGFFTVKGLFRGLVKEVGGIVGLLVAFLIASTQIGKGSRFIQSAFKISPGVSHILGFIAIFIAVLVLVRLLEGFLLKLFKVTSMLWLDKLGGGVLGFLFGYLIIAVFIVLLMFVPFSDSLKREQNDSILYPYAEYFSRYLYKVVLKINPGADKIKSIIDKQIKAGISEGDRYTITL